MIRFFAALIFSIIVIGFALFLFRMQVLDYNFSFDGEKDALEEFSKNLENFSTSTIGF